uniref:Immunoglobulin domain-containing protein n=1 Tax=Poecilia latipinna TaxID=48699 RepID=A0A3B3VBX0_9TELE
MFQSKCNRLANFLLLFNNLVWCALSFMFFCLETKEVIWRETGQSVTIRCRINTDQDFLVLKMGHNEETEVAFINRASRKRHFHKRIAGRVQTNGTFPSVDIVIENLNVSDSGPYWCVYSKLDDSYRQLVTKGYGSVLLMVTGDCESTTTTIMEVPKCDASSLTLVVVYVRITVIVLIGLMLGFSTLIMYKVC